MFQLAWADEETGREENPSHIEIGQQNRQSVHHIIHPIVWAVGDQGIEAVHSDEFIGASATSAKSARPVTPAPRELLHAGFWSDIHRFCDQAIWIHWKWPNQVGLEGEKKCLCF